jgi:hypothetical protein
MDVSLRGHLKEHIYAVLLPKTIKDLVARYHAAVTMMGANMLRHIQENTTWHTSICLEMAEGHFDHLL